MNCKLDPVEKLSSKADNVDNDNDNFRLDVCQKVYTTGFLGKKFYSLKVRELRLFLLKKKQHK